MNTYKTQFINGIAYSQMLTTMEYKLTKKEDERRKVFGRLTSLSVFALVISFLSTRHLFFLQRAQNMALLPLLLRKAAHLLPSAVKCYCSCLWMDKRCSFTVIRFLTVWLCSSHEFYAGFFSCVTLGLNLGMYEICHLLPLTPVWAIVVFAGPVPPELTADTLMTYIV